MTTSTTRSCEQTDTTRSTSDRRLLAASLAVAALYAAPLYFPPATASIAPTAPDASLLVRLFPGVPPWWVAARLVCAAVALVLAALASRSPLRADDEDAAREPPAPRQPWTSAALGVAALHAAASWNAAQLGRGLQIVYFGLLALPPLLLAVGSRRRRSATPRATKLGPALGTGALIATWLVLRFVAGRHSVRAANLVDGWDGFDCLLKAARADFNVVVDACYAGYTALPLIVQGAGVLGHWLPLSFESVQIVHLAWIAAGAALVACAAADLFGTSAAPVAAAIFLFAPPSLMTPLWPAGPFVFALYTAALLVAALRIERSGSPTAVAAFGGLAGIACRCPPLIAIVPLLAAWALSSPRARTKALIPAYATAALSFCAALAPSLREWSNVGHALATYGHGGKAAWLAMEAALFGQFAPQSAEGAIGAASARPLDVALSLLAAPLATPRTAARLWGDAILDPIGAALMVVGLGALLGAAVSSRRARMLIGLLVAAMLPGALAGYDRPSLTRVAAMAVPLALLGAAGFEVVWQSLLPRRLSRVAVATIAVAIAASGTFLFDVVNARILASSSLAIALSARHSAGRDVVVLDEMLWKPSYTRAIGENVPDEPLRVLARSAVPDLLRVPEPPLIFWSPGQEEDYAVSGAICRAWPDATLYELRDATALTRVFAAGSAGSGRVDAWSESARDCATGLDTEVTRGERALAQSSTLAKQGRLRAAAEVLEAQARQTFGYARIFDATARALLAAPAGSGDVARAVEWASRACAATDHDDPLFCATLADAHAANGAWQEAIRAARLAKEAALRRGQGALADELEVRIQDYVRAASGG